MYNIFPKTNTVCTFIIKVPQLTIMENNIFWCLRITQTSIIRYVQVGVFQNLTYSYIVLLLGLERLIPPGHNPLDPHWLEMQRRYGSHMIPGPSGSSHLPGIYPPTSIASDLMARERERLERLGK